MDGKECALRPLHSWYAQCRIIGSSFFGRVSSYDPSCPITEKHTPSGAVLPALADCVELVESYAATHRAIRGSSPPLNYAIAFVGAIYGPGSWFMQYYLGLLKGGIPIEFPQPTPLW